MFTQVNHTEPKIDERAAQAYVGIRERIPMERLTKAACALIGETAEWLRGRGVESVGLPFIRYHVIDMECNLDVEIGWLLGESMDGDERVSSGVLPAGRYASLVFTDDASDGIEGNKVLIEWARAKGIEWDAWDTEQGHAFRSRVEIFLDGSVDNADPATWRTEVAIKLMEE